MIRARILRRKKFPSHIFDSSAYAVKIARARVKQYHILPAATPHHRKWTPSSSD